MLQVLVAKSPLFFSEKRAHARTCAYVNLYMSSNVEKQRKVSLEFCQRLSRFGPSGATVKGPEQGVSGNLGEWFRVDGHLRLQASRT